ncbi:DUF362 domain-containing protein [Candidatus Bathyarchaeota archaeon]|nr:DUF362 domain-containing protein [Candidatus Bathyarchaeota archaeon]
MVSKSIAEVKAVVSIAKLEVHVSFGVSLTIKNLFGLPPHPRSTANRSFYIHYPVRLPDA